MGGTCVHRVPRARTLANTLGFLAVTGMMPHCGPAGPAGRLVRVVSTRWVGVMDTLIYNADLAPNVRAERAEYWARAVVEWTHSVNRALRKVVAAMSWPCAPRQKTARASRAPAALSVVTSRARVRRDATRFVRTARFRRRGM